MQKKIAVLAGDGIGPEVCREAIRVLDAVAQRFGHQWEYDHAIVGAAAIDATGDPYPAATQAACKGADAILFGAIGDPKYDNDPSAKVRPEQGLLKMRKDLNLFANIRPVTAYEPLLEMSPLKSHIISGTDFVVFRELTGGIYFGQPRGRSEDGSTAFDSCIYHVEEIDRVSRLAFQAAENRKAKLTLVDKANVLATSRLWRDRVKKMAAEFPKVEVDYMFVDNAAMKIIQQPASFDVILTENMFGDILTDEASVISGSLGLLPSASVGGEHMLFEPIHGSYPQAAGQNRANPMGAILSAAMMIDYAFGCKEESDCIKLALEDCLLAGEGTEDLFPKSAKTTEEVGSVIANRLLKLSEV
ncbi:MAG: 3-isopropylmalate dehydrogenase [Cyclobacteriaceae bacterium]|nr:3-isopropylmalate dehydrogenase [Cyclobacteriaceae bacterium]MCH8514767.1 3-isopropylmalate dehydrogenase [Cyclobacteriaceae bacterium]